MAARWTALHESAYNGNVDEVKRLLLINSKHIANKVSKEGTIYVLTQCLLFCPPNFRSFLQVVEVFEIGECYCHCVCVFVSVRC